MGPTATAVDAGAYSYELKMMASLLMCLEERANMTPTGPWDAVESNAVLEAFLLHTRVLISFFLPSKVFKGDILASQFFAEDWSPSGDHVERLTKLSTELDKRLAHLTQRRHEAFEGYVPLLIAGDVMNLHGRFRTMIANKAPESDEWFSESDRVYNNFASDYMTTYLALAQGFGLKPST